VAAAAATSAVASAAKVAAAAEAAAKMAAAAEAAAKVAAAAEAAAAEAAAAEAVAAAAEAAAAEAVAAAAEDARAAAAWSTQDAEEDAALAVEERQIAAKKAKRIADRVVRDNEAKKPKAASSSNAPPADPRRGAPGNSKALPLVFPAASPQVKNAVSSFQTQLKGYAAARQDTAVPWAKKAKLPDCALAHVRTSDLTLTLALSLPSTALSTPSSAARGVGSYTESWK
jgi:hypothetical protein